MTTSSIAFPSSLNQAYQDLSANSASDVLPNLPSCLTRDHLDDLRHACLVDIAHLEGTLGINGWEGRNADEIDSEDPDAVLFLRESCMAARRLLAWTESQLKQEGTNG